MPDSLWFAITSLGSAGLMLPVAAVVAGQLVAARAWRIASWWSLSFAGAVGVVLVSKIAFLGWGLGIRSLNFTGVSGHAMLATAVLPVLGFLLFLHREPRLLALGALCGLVLSLAVGASRWVLGAHSPAEVVAGIGLGAWVAGSFIHSIERMRKPVLDSWVMTALLILVAALHYGYAKQIYSHDLIVKLALQASGHKHPFSRADWHLGD